MKVEHTQEEENNVKQKIRDVNRSIDRRLDR